MARVGLPKKYAKMGFAKGWRAYKASKRKKSTASRPKPRKSVTKTIGARAPAKRRAPVAKRKKGRIRRRATVAVKRTVYRARPLFQRGTKQVLQTLTTAGSVLGANAISNFTPVLKDWTGNQKAGGQAAIGLSLMLFVKNPWVKYVGGGMMLAGAFNVARQIPQLSTLLGADEGAVLTRDEMAFLTTNAGNQMGVPERMGVQANYLEEGRHRTVTSSNSMGVPEQMGWGHSGASWGY